MVQCMCVKTQGTKSNTLLFLQQKGKRRTQHETVPAAARQGAPLTQALLHKGMSIKGETCKLRSWKTQRHQTWHGTPNTSCCCSTDSSAPYPGWRKLITSSSPSYPRQSRTSSPISLETCQEFPKPMKAKTEENKCPATNALSCGKAE